MRNIYTQIGLKTLLQLNVISIVIIAFCEIFALSMFFTKGFQEGIEKWKFISLITGVVIISLLFVGSIASFIFFMRMKYKDKP